MARKTTTLPRFEPLVALGKWRQRRWHQARSAAKPQKADRMPLTAPIALHYKANWPATLSLKAIHCCGRRRANNVVAEEDQEERS